MGPLRLALSAAVLLGTLYAAELVYAFRTIAPQNTPRAHFDVLIVLGNPSYYNGAPSPEQRERVMEGVREFQAGVAPHMITTGGAVLNQYEEGHVMAQLAQAQGVPAAAIAEEVEARNTIQNIFYSRGIMQQHGWHSAEVISSPSHLPRTALILDHYQGPLYFDWRTHPARWPPEYWYHRPVRYYFEANACLLFRALGFHPSSYLPGGR